MTNAPQLEVLCIGHQRQLLALRRIILRSEGYRVLEVYTVEEALDVFSSTDVDVAVVCHSIPIQSSKPLVRAMKQARPLTPVIALHEAYDLISEADLSVDHLAGPEALLEALAVLLKRPVQRAVLRSQSRQAKPSL